MMNRFYLPAPTQPRMKFSERTLTQAAERLHVSQPAASAQIKAIEREFGIKFFERHPSGLRLTNTGAALLPEIRKLLHIADGLSLNARRLRGRLSGTVKVAIVSPTVADTSLLRLGDIMKAMVTRYPMLAIEVHNRNSRSIVCRNSQPGIRRRNCAWEPANPERTAHPS
jgi:DNA-binding transcriptional LysR family regulator